MLRTLDDFDDAPFGPTASVLPDDACLDAVLVEHRAHLIGRQVDVGFTIVALYEPMSVAMSLHRSFDLIQQAAGLAIIFDMIALFPEIQNLLLGLFRATCGPRWRNW